MTENFDLDARPADSLLNDVSNGGFDESNANSQENHLSATEPGDAQAEAASAQPVEEAVNGFTPLGLAPELLAAIRDMGFTEPTAVQARAIPMAMQGVGAADGKFTDLIVSSQTGSGKTAAFLLPMLHTLLMQQQEQAQAETQAWNDQVAQAAAAGQPAPKRPKRKDPTNPRNFKPATPGALILCPTRELAQQVAQDAIDLVRHCRGLRVANVVGGIPYALQIAKLQNANLVVATPGRLLDLQRSSQIKLDQVQFVVMDEADRMLDLGFSDDLAEINQITMARKQTMMFSATFAPRIQQLAMRAMRQPKHVQIDSPQEKHANIKQVMFWADNPQHKRALLDHWLRDTNINQAIVFASTQIECDGLANDLQQSGFSAVALHGALSQGLRNRRLMALRNGQVQILVATDVAARGIDVPTITHVFNFGLPMKAEDYTHRIGRTGRAGRDGLAVTFAEFRDRRRIFEIEAYTKQTIGTEVIPGLEPQQRFPTSRPQGDFGGGRPGQGRGRPGAPRDHRFGGGGGNGGGYGRSNNFGDGGDRARRDGPPAGGRFGGSGGGHNAGFGGGNGGGGYGAGHNAGHGGNGGPFAGKPAKAGAFKGNGGGKSFVPRDGKPAGRPFKPARPAR